MTTTVKQILDQKGSKAVSVHPDDTVFTALSLMAEFDIGETHLRLHSDAQATWLPEGAKKGVGLGLHLGVIGIDEHYRRLLDLGMHLPEAPTTLHTGIRKFAMKDPDGYEVEFVEPPAKP